MILRCIIFRYIIPASNNGYVYWPIICFKHVQFQYIISCNIYALHVFSNLKPAQGSIVSILCKHLHFAIQRFSQTNFFFNSIQPLQSAFSHDFSLSLSSPLLNQSKQSSKYALRIYKHHSTFKFFIVVFKQQVLT